RWRLKTPYAKNEDWIFASARMGGRQPLWREALMRSHIGPPARPAGITKQNNQHRFSHTFSTFLAANREGVETVQLLFRDPKPSITLGIYTHAVSSKKREAQSRVVEMVLPQDPKAALVAVAAKGTA